MGTPLKPERPTLSRAVTIGLFVCATVVILCGLYLWGAMLSQETAVPRNFTPPTNNEPETPRADADVQILNTVSSSDELYAVEADLESTNLDALDKELDLIENDLKQP